MACAGSRSGMSNCVLGSADMVDIIESACESTFQELDPNAHHFRIVYICIKQGRNRNRSRRITRHS